MIDFGEIFTRLRRGPPSVTEDGPDRSFHELVDCLTQRIECLLVVMLDSVDDAVLDMILQDDLADVVDGGADGGDLDENLAAITAALDHPAHGFQMPDGAGQAVQDGLRVLMDMSVFAARMVVVVALVVRVAAMVQVGNIVFMQVCMVVRMLVIHRGDSLYQKVTIMYHIRYGNST